MSISYRPMRREDVAECAGIIGRHPFLGPRYGDAICHLAPVWSALLASDACVSAVFEERRGNTCTILGGGIDVFVSCEFAEALKTPPHFWIGPEIVRRICAGCSPVLTDRQVGEANSSGRLYAAVWHTGVSPHDLARAEVGNTIHSAFNDLHSGYQLTEVVTQSDSRAHVEGICSIGLRCWNGTRGRYQPIEPAQTENLLAHPHVVGISREVAASLSGCWAGSTFLYRPPHFGFRRSEQKLLSCGLLGGTDDEIADQLGISLDAVRKTWRNIYDRVATVDPELLPDTSSRRNRPRERGKGKKQRLLAYLHHHPEELRPISRKLLEPCSVRTTVRT